MQANDETLMEMYNAARQAVEFAGGVNRTAFMVDAKTRSAVLYQLLVLAEAAKRLGLHRSNLYRKMRQLGMTTDE